MVVDRGGKGGVRFGEEDEETAFVGLSFWDGGVDAVLCRTRTWGSIDRLHKSEIKRVRGYYVTWIIARDIKLHA